MRAGVTSVAEVRPLAGKARTDRTRESSGVMRCRQRHSIGTQLVRRRCPCCRHWVRVAVAARRRRTELAACYLDACDCRPTDAGLIQLTSLAKGMRHVPALWDAPEA